MKTKTTDYELWALLDATGFAISRLRQLELARLHLTIEQAALLRHIHSAGSWTTVRRIKEATLRQQHTISILVNRMARMGLVAKERRPGDRESRILLTPRGRNLLKKSPTASLDAVFAALAPRERRPFACALREIHDKARSMLVPETPPFMQYVDSAVAGERAEPEPGDPGAFTSYRLWAALDSARFAVSRLRELELARFGLTVEQSSILKVLADRGQPVTARDLEYATLRQHHSISTLVNRMLKADLVAVTRSPGQKGHRILVTGGGRRLLGEVTTAAIDVTFGVLTESEKRRLSACLRSLYTRARDLLGAPSAPSPAVVLSSD